MRPEASTLESSPPWWRGGVIYQIYPRSYADQNGDGIGDLAGIIERLDYIAGLGVEAIWISPFFRSPMKDFGYDVEDHRAVDPMFGDAATFDRLITEAHARGVRVMIDLVLSHTADTHPWFIASRASAEGPYADRYVWADARPDGTPPNNWLSIFGGPAWQWEPRRRQYYLHNFLVSQPDLNFHHPAVYREALDIARYWLERGVDGFRLDTINFYFHDPKLRSNPAAARDEVDASMASDVNPYGMQDHRFDKNQPETLPFLEDFARVLAEHDGVALGEVGAAQTRATRLMAEYTRPGRLQLCYAFDLLSPRFSAGHIAEVLQRFAREAPDGWPCWAFSNHDVRRVASRFCPAGGDPEQIARLALGLLLCLRGTICLYQGEELGLTEAEIPYEALVDPYGQAFWPEFKGRDGCRTPMPWTDTPDGGFGSAAPWLPMPTEHRQRAVAVQEADPQSVLHLCRRLLARRRATPALRVGESAVVVEGAVLRVQRGEGAEAVWGVFNLGGVAAAARCSGPLGAVLEGVARVEGGVVELPPWGWAWIAGRR